MIPGSANPLLLKSAAAAGYQIERSLRFNSSDSAYLSRTPSSAGNRKTWTFSCWVKRSALGGNRMLMSCQGNSDSTTAQFWFNSDQFMFGVETANLLTTTAVFRDVSAWYHIVFAFDSTNATAADRMILYVNGVRQAASTYTAPTPNADYGINRNVEHNIGRRFNNSDFYFDGYLADIYFIDGQALTPSSFTEVSATTGQLIPKAYTGSFGTNGFWLKFSDNSAATATTLGKDYSGNSNNWTPNNLSVTAGAGNDSLVDTPTSYGTDTSVGGEVRGNYCTWNPLDNAGTLANGNLDFSQASAVFRNVRSTFGVSSGKWYWEGTLSAFGGAPYIGIGKSTASLTIANIGYYDSWAYSWTGNKQTGNTAEVAYGSSYTTNDVIGVAFDADNGTLTFYKNGTSQGQAYSGLTSGPYFMMVTGYNGTTWAANFGQRPWAYTAPSGFKALCDTNLPSPLIAKPSTVMDVALYSGNSSTQSISGYNLSPDFVWVKTRSQANNNFLFDAVRGVGNWLISDSTTAETYSANTLTSFDSGGFTTGSNNDTNASGRTFVAWMWDAGSSTVTNTQGSITSQVRANASAGFSVVSWTAGTAPVTIGHGLGVAPQFIIIKSRTSGAVGWQIGHVSLGWTKRLFFDTAAADTTTAAWNDTSPTSTVFTIGSTGYQTGNMIAYCFAPVVGYSSFGVWQHNNSNDGPFIYTGFRPKLILLKNSDNAEQWFMFDSARRTYNLAAGTDTSNLRPNSSGAEGSYSNQATIDFLSNGFKIRTTTPDEIAFGTRSYIYAAWAESPFQYARAR